MTSICFDIILLKSLPFTANKPDTFWVRL